MATQPAPKTMWRHVGEMPKLANLLLGLGVLALAAAWFSPILLSPAKGDGKACTLQEGKAAESPDDKFRILAIQPVDFRRQDAICVTVENVVSKAEAGSAKQAENNAAARLDAAEAGQKAAEDESFSAPTPEARAVAKQKADVLGARAVAARQKVSDLAAARTASSEKRHYVLYLNGKKSPFTADADPIPGQQVLVFRLEDSADASSDLGVFWRNAITKPIIDGRLDAHLALGDGTGPVIPYVAGETVVNRVVMYSWAVRILSSFALLAMLAWLVVLSIRTPLLRVDDTPNSCFSLARVQMMFWLVLVSGGFLYIWFVVGQWLNVMNSSTFALLGISGAAAGAALTIDSAKNPPAGAAALAPVPMDSQGFFRDIASDGASYIQLQRIQMILWTLILGGIFVYTVVIKLELPAFDSNLLALAGIVNGVYVALKTQEKPPAPAATPAP
jgi:hypothetical protein